MVRIQHFHHCSPGLIPGLGIEVPHQATECRNQKRRKKGAFLWFSRLRIQHCQGRGLGRCGSSGSTPSLGTSACCGCCQKRKKKKKDYVKRWVFLPFSRPDLPRSEQEGPGGFLQVVNRGVIAAIVTENGTSCCRCSLPFTTACGFRRGDFPSEVTQGLWSASSPASHLAFLITLCPFCFTDCLLGPGVVPFPPSSSG